MLKSAKHIPIAALILATALIGLLGALAALQYKWLGELSESKLELTRSALRAGALRLGEDFDHELTSVFVNLQMNGSALRSGDGGDYAKAYSQWVATASYPKLIRHLYLVRARDEGQLQLYKFNQDSCQLELSAWPGNLEALRRRITERYQQILFPDRSFNTDPLTLIDGEIPALIIPTRSKLVTEEQPERVQREILGPTVFGCTIALLDLDYIKQEVIPTLAKRYFSGSDDDGKLDYDLLIVSRRNPARTIYFSAPESTGRPISEADVKVDLFRLQLASLARMYSDRFSSIKLIRSNRGSPRGPGKSSPLPLNLRRQFLKQFLETSQEGQWQMALIHRAGSLQNAVAEVRYRNLLIGFGVLALLSASIIMIFVLIRRRHLLAKQQMEFVAGVSHELRTPVAVLCSASENLADGMVQSREDILQYAEMIRSESYQLAELIEQALEFAGAQSLRHPYHLSPVPIAEVIGSSLTLYARQIADQGFTVEKNLQSDLPPVMADKAALGRAIQNLLANAIKFSGTRRLIKIRAQTGRGKCGREVMISVQDHGIGIEPDELRNIFEPFRRGKAVISSQIHGNGLGLSVVKHIAEGHNGRVSVRSAPGRGSTFTLHLPAVSERVLG